MNPPKSKMRFRMVQAWLLFGRPHSKPNLTSTFFFQQFALDMFWPVATDGYRMDGHPQRKWSHWAEALPSFHSSDVASRGGGGFAAPWTHRPQRAVHVCWVPSGLWRPRLWTTHGEKIWVYSAEFVWTKCIWVILDSANYCARCKWLWKWLCASLRMNLLFVHTCYSWFKLIVTFQFPSGKFVSLHGLEPNAALPETETTNEVDWLTPLSTGLRSTILDAVIGLMWVNHPPVITILIGGMFTIPSPGWWHCFSHINCFQWRRFGKIFCRIRFSP